MSLQLGRSVRYARAMTVVLEPSDAGFAEAARLLQRGEVVGLPTETVYGLAGDARRDAAVAAIYQAKGRPSDNPLIVHVESLAQVQTLVTLPPAGLALAHAFWPGPLTLVAPLRADAGLSSRVTADLSTLAVRIPAHPVARAVLSAFGGPLAAPSANPSGRISPTSAAHVLDGLSGRIAAVVDGGASPVGLESTIVNVAGPPALLRPGTITAAQIQEVLGAPLIEETQGEVLTAPGQMTSHYAPRVAVRLNAQSARPGEVLLGFGAMPCDLNLSPAGDLDEAARTLFDCLRRLDQQGRPIAVAPLPTDGVGRALNDRLQRAAAPRD